MNKIFLSQNDGKRSLPEKPRFSSSLRVPLMTKTAFTHNDAKRCLNQNVVFVVDVEKR